MDAKGHFINFSLPFNEDITNYRNYMYTLRNDNIVAVQKNILVEFFHQNSYYPKLQGNLLISSVELQDTTLLLHSALEKIELGVNNNNFNLKYAAFGNSQESFHYYYQLKGFDEKWIDAGTKTIAHYTNVPGGKYEFLVKVVTAKNESKTLQFFFLI